MAKSFIELTNEATVAAFECQQLNDGQEKHAPVDLVLQSIIDSGISAGIPRALYLLMEKDPREEVSIEVGPFTYGVSLKKTGESMSLNPMFSLTNEKKTINELGEYEEKMIKLIPLIDSVSQSITNDLLLETVIHTCKLDEYDTTTSAWVEKVNDADKGVDLDRYTVSFLIASHVVAILHVLANQRNAEELVKYEVPGEGTYTIQSVKGKWEIGFIASKEFKQAIKNDRLVDALA